MTVGRMSEEPSVTGVPSSGSGTQSLPLLSTSSRSGIRPLSLIAASSALATASSLAEATSVAVLSSCAPPRARGTRPSALSRMPACGPELVGIVMSLSLPCRGRSPRMQRAKTPVRLRGAGAQPVVSRSG